MNDFSLRALTRDLITEGDSADPRDLADQLVRSLPADHMDECLRLMAVTYVRDVIQSERGNAHRAVATPARGSRKVAAAREAWQRLLDVPEFVGSTNSWVHLRAATREQVLEMAASRTARAVENEAAAARYRAIAEHMRRLKAVTVQDLPADVLIGVLSPEVDAA